MTFPNRITVAGVAGGVGTTVTSRILGADDFGLDAERADVVVARNDYRCAAALHRLGDKLKGKTVLVLVEPNRALSVNDISMVIPKGTLLRSAPTSDTIARADDAGLLDSSVDAQNLRDMILSALCIVWPPDRFGKSLTLPPNKGGTDRV